jgi:hypothetical protein
MILRALHVCIAENDVTQSRLALFNRIRENNISPPVIRRGPKLNKPECSGDPGSWQQYISVAYRLLKKPEAWDDEWPRMVEMANGLGRAAVSQGRLKSSPITHYHIPSLILTREKVALLHEKSPRDAFMLAVMHIVDVTIQRERQNFLVHEVTLMCHEMVVKTVLAKKINPEDQVALFTKYPRLFASLAPPQSAMLQRRSL